MDIAFNINHLALEGFGATLTSLCRNCSDTGKLTLWFLCSDFNPSDKQNIQNLLNSEKFNGHFKFIDFDARAQFGSYKSLHGDWTAYGRLLIPVLIPSDTVLYLDADLVIQIDILRLENFAFNGAFLAAAFGSEVKWTLEHKFFIGKLNWSPETACFNSGVLLFNVKAWKDHNIDERWKKLAGNYPNELLSADQTILNAICEGKFARLDARYNNIWDPAWKSPEHDITSILHFVGSPKPWDVMGAFIHSGYTTWKKFNTNEWERLYSGISVKKLTRFWRIKKSYLNKFRERLKLSKYSS